MAGNQLGKTLAGGMEVAIHLTGLYPEWWEGRRFTSPTRWWAGGDTSESTRDNPQRILVGQPDQEREWGTGTIPLDTLVDVQRARGIPNSIDTLTVKHTSGGFSYLGFKSYEKGRKKWQGETLHGVWCDEEPPPDIYSEALTRTNVHMGLMLVTFTPLLGMSDVVRMFLNDEQIKEMNNA